MRTGLVAGVIVTGLTIVLAGCGTGTSAPPEPVRQSSTPAASPIPPVKNPRDVATLVRRPCELLTARQATEFELDVPPQQAVYNREHARPFFELTEIAGYPAIVTRSNADLPHCDFNVKPAEHQSFSVSYDSKLFKNDPQQACVMGKQVAAAVLMNLPPKS